MNFTPVAALLIAFAAASAANAQTKPAQSKPAPAVAAAAQMKPGLWEISIVEQAPNSTNKRTITARTCHTAEDVKVIDRILPQQREFGTKCEHRDVKAQGAAVSWRLVCTSKEGAITGTATMTPGVDSFSAQATLESKSKGKAGKIEQAIAGKWISECT